jgi:hypothetical protein
MKEKRKAMKTNKAEVLKLRQAVWNTREALVPKKNDREKRAKIPHDKIHIPNKNRIYLMVNYSTLLT